MMLATAATIALAAPGLADSQALADHVWNHPCPEGVTLTFEPLPAGWLGAADASACRVWINPTRRNRPWDPAWLCTIVLHEYGHLAGMGHSTNPRSIMFVRIWRVDRRCRMFAVAQPASVPS